MWCLIVSIPDLCSLSYFAQGHNTMSPVRLEPATLRSLVKHSTTEPLCSLSDCASCLAGLSFQWAHMPTFTFCWTATHFIVSQDRISVSDIYTTFTHHISIYINYTFILANSADLDDMPHFSASHMGLLWSQYI